MFENNNNTYNGYNRQYPYQNRDASELYGQRIYPDPTAHGTGREPQMNQTLPPAHKPEKKPLKAPRIVAAALSMALIGGAAGGGAAYLVMEQYGAQAVAPVAGEIQETTTPTTPAPVTNTVVSGTGDVSSVVDKAAASVVEIVTEETVETFFTQQTTKAGAGSGVILTEDGYIVTNHHVIEDATTVTVRTQDGTEYNAKLVGTDSKTDLAVIKVEAEGLQPATLADSDSIQVGALAVAIGNPLGQLGGTVTSGIISATGREITVGDESMTLLQTSAAVNPGNSGGGLFDENGLLVGVVNAKSSGVDVEGLAFAIPSNTVKQVTDDIIDKGYVTGRPQFGIKVIEVNDPRSLLMYRLDKAGVYIAEVDDASSGLKAGDRIAAINGEEIETSGDVSGALNSYAVGDTVTVTVERDGAAQDVRVTLTEQVPESLQPVEDNI